MTAVLREDYIEEWLLKNLALEMEKYNLEIRPPAAKRVKVDERQTAPQDGKTQGPVSGRFN